MAHLHLIREVKPETKPHYKFVTVWCEHCNAEIYVIHLDLPPEDHAPAKEG